MTIWNIKREPWKADNPNTYPVSNVLEYECVEKADNATCIILGSPCAICICLWCKKMDFSLSTMMHDITTEMEEANKQMRRKIDKVIEFNGDT